MNLTYRGVVYNASAPNVEVTETDQNGTFLGARFSRKQYQVAHRRPQAEELTFLGRRYTR
ncbi:MAG TPA: DUF4278 domain-containing protein [Trichocoleus sp.]